MFKKKKILCLIPARGGSKGIRLKNLKKIGNYSLVGHSIRFASSLKYIDQIIVSSDNKKIINVAKKLNVGIHVRSKKLSKDFVSDINLILNLLKEKKYKLFDYLLYLQPTSPFRYKPLFKQALQKLIYKKADAIWSVTKVSVKNHPLKILKKNNNNFIKPYLDSGKKVVARQQLGEIYIRNGIFYFFSIKALLRKKTIYLKRTMLSEVKYNHFNIDNQNDLRLARLLYKKNGEKF